MLRSEARALDAGGGRGGEEVEALWRWVSWWPKRAAEERKCVPGEGSADWGAWVVGVGVV